MKRGKRLLPGDTIGVVAPAGFTDPDTTATGIQRLEAMGYAVRLGESCQSRWHSYAGSDPERAGDVHRFFEDPDIQAIICLRGGYGSLRLLDLLDWDLITAHPKPFVGYSDITVLHVALNQRCGLITFHGPMLASTLACDPDPETLHWFEQSINRGYQPYPIFNPSGQPLQALSGGIACGRLIGGNLISLMSLLGTTYEPDLQGKILFIEEIKEATYRIDRALTQLLLSGQLNQVAGIILGNFKDCNPSDPEDMSLDDLFSDRLGSLGIPVIANLGSGHCRPLITLPLGAMVRIDACRLTIEVLENVVE